VAEYSVPREILIYSVFYHRGDVRDHGDCSVVSTVSGKRDVNISVSEKTETNLNGPATRPVP
jgi:hypothetical protein